MSRRAYVVIALVSGLLLAVSATALTSRLVAFYKANPSAHWIFQELDDRSFTYADKSVTLEDETDPAGTLFLNVRYEGEALRLRVTIPHKQHKNLAGHGLAAHRDWMRLVRFAEVSGIDADDAVEQMKQGKITDRLALVTRTPRAGVDPNTWGEAWRKDWSFDFHEFLPSGGFDSTKLHYPTNKRGQPAKPGELVEGTWQFDAALLTMPKSGIPNQQFINTGFKAMGWTFPAACLSSVALAVSFMMAAYRPKAGTPRPALSVTAPQA
jgi:hypothetical protein